MPDKPIVFNGIIYQKDPCSSSPYRRSYACDAHGQSLHCAMWEFYHGPIPKGFHVHHKDGKKWHNEIDNFELLSSSDHTKEHWARKFFLQRTCLQCGIKFKTRSTKGIAVKFCSNTCKANHRRLSRKDFITRPCTNCTVPLFRSRFKFGMGLCVKCARKTRSKPIIIIDRSARPCKFCQIPFEPHKMASRKTVFCSKRCKAADRRARMVDFEISECPVCGDGFYRNKYDRNVHCSKSCASRSREQKQRGNPLANRQTDG